MLRSWIGTQVSVDDYYRLHYRQAPLAQPTTVARAPELLDWQILGEVLASDPAPDVLVVGRGQLLPLPPPRDLDTLKVYLRLGAGLCVRHSERHHPKLRVIGDAFEAEFQRPAQVQLFVTPAETHGFGWHYDDEDVFICQTAGAKDYYFRANTVAAEHEAHSTVFRDAYPRETSPLCTARLIAGDFLYLPSRWWHMAVCREDALSVSVGVFR